jgi:hypothetical protein
MGMRLPPVRIGSDAHGLQLDVYGEVIDAVFRFAERGSASTATRRLLDGLGHTVCAGVSQTRYLGGAFRPFHTAIEGAVLVLLTHLIQCIASPSSVRGRFRVEREAIRTEIESRGFSERIVSYIRTFDGDELDASLLTLPLHGYVDAAHPRMRDTWARICEQLGRGPLIYRYQGTDDGLPQGEGAFGICSFWAVECLARWRPRTGDCRL